MLNCLRVNFVICRFVGVGALLLPVDDEDAKF